MAPVALDADVLIAFLDASDAQHESAVDALRPRLASGEQLLIAASVYAEILVRPLQRGTVQSSTRSSIATSRGARHSSEARIVRCAFPTRFHSQQRLW